MPYIKQFKRDEFDPYIEDLIPDNGGELNYIFTRIAHEYFNRPSGGDYRAINDIIGALEGAKLEFYRRKAVPYEDGKIAENGDV